VIFISVDRTPTRDDARASLKAVRAELSNESIVTPDNVVEAENSTEVLAPVVGCSVGAADGSVVGQLEGRTDDGAEVTGLLLGLRVGILLVGQPLEGTLEGFLEGRALDGKEVGRRVLVGALELG
jgi:hypothetical protein